ncbi:MAG: cyclic pyranopterin monophosphate synthase MoaC [Pirellula sp.]|jgi:cyclic pyranopterin phosphate synthase
MSNPSEGSSSSRESNESPGEPLESGASELTHVDSLGHAKMVDVGGKSETVRQATASSRISMTMAAATAIRRNTLSKGDAIAVARIAAIGAVKQTSNLIPLCHPLWVDGVRVQCDWVEETVLEWRVTVKSTGKTGVEMEALTGATVAALTIYDMGKAIDRSMEITSVKLLEKSGGSRGDYLRTE